jgi:hypothetical protein
MAEVKKRGRPRKVVQEEPTDIEVLIAQYIATNICTILGCGYKNHLEDAKEIISKVKN